MNQSEDFTFEDTVTELMEGIGELMSLENTGFHVSLYCPVGSLPGYEENARLSFQNKIRAVLERAKAQALSGESDAVVSAVSDYIGLSENPDFWLRKRGTVVIFANSTLSKQFVLPTLMLDHAVISPHFYTKPILSHFSGLDSFNLLQVKSNCAHLFRVSRMGIQKARSWNRSVCKIGSTQKDVEALKSINQYVCKSLSDKEVPLFLVGESQFTEPYRSVSSYLYLSEMTVRPKSISHLSKGEELVSWLFAFARKDLEMSLKRSVNRIQRLSETNHDYGIVGTEKLLRAASQSFIDQAYLPSDIDAWGEFDLTHQEVILSGNPLDRCASDLHELIGRLVMAMGREVMFVDASLLPESKHPAGSIIRDFPDWDSEPTVSTNN